MRRSSGLVLVSCGLVALVGVTAGFLGCTGSRGAPPSYAPPPATMPPPGVTYAPAPPPAGTPSMQPQPPAGSMPPSNPVEAQVSRGAMVFQQICAQCHGAAGQGSPRAPALIGAGSLPLDPRPGSRLRRVQFRTAHDVGMFIKGNMPPGGPALSMEDAAAALSYVLRSNGVNLTQTVTPTSSSSIVLH